MIRSITITKAIVKLLYVFPLFLCGHLVANDIVNLKQQVLEKQIAYGERIAKQNNLKLLLTGYPACFISPTFNISFADYHNTITVNQGREQTVSLISDFWNMLQASSEVHCLYEAMLKARFFYVPAELTLEQVSLRLTYWDEATMTRRMPPYLAEIRFKNQKLYYYEADPQTQELKLIHEESYDDALQYLNKKKS
jgi:hypothetical protein